MFYTQNIQTMKKTILLIFTLTFFLNFVNAQVTITPYVQAGINFDTPNPDFIISSDHIITNNPKIGHAAGLLINYRFVRSFELRVGVAYQDLGDKGSVEYVNNTPSSSLNVFLLDVGEVDFVESRTRTTHIHLPLQLQYNFEPVESFTPYIALGTNFSWHTGGTTLSKGYLEDEYIGEVKNNYDFENVASWGANFDIGFNRQITEKLALNAFISSNADLFRISSDFGLDARRYNISLGLGLGYAL